MIQKAPKPQSLLLDILSPFLLFIPHAQLVRLEAVIVDGFVTLPQLEQFIDRLQEERKETVVIVSPRSSTCLSRSLRLDVVQALGTILVNFISQAGPIFRSRRVESYGQWLQFASYMSLLMSVFGALLGLLMCRDHKFKGHHRWHRTVGEIVGTNVTNLVDALTRFGFRVVCKRLWDERWRT